MTNKKPFVKWALHGIELPFHQNLICWLSPTAALEQSLRAIWDAASRAADLLLPQIKLNSQVTSCTSFFLVDITNSIKTLKWSTSKKKSLQKKYINSGAMKYGNCKEKLLGVAHEQIWRQVSWGYAGGNGENILVSSSCCNKYQRVAGSNSRHSPLRVLEAESLRSGCQHGWILGELSLPGPHKASRETERKLWSLR